MDHGKGVDHFPDVGEVEEEDEDGGEEEEAEGGRLDVGTMVTGAAEAMKQGAESSCEWSLLSGRSLVAWNECASVMKVWKASCS